jgi:DNA-binding winged helix-turn-helix (wHTH) protein
MAASIRLYKFAEFIINPAKRTIFRDDAEIKLRDKDFEILLFLIENAPNTCSHDEIIKTVWNGTNVANSSIEKAVGNIRCALGDKAKNPRFIKTIRAKGYLFIGDLEKIVDTAAIETDGEAKNFKPEKAKSPILNKKSLMFAGFALLLALAGLVRWKGVEIWNRYSATVIFADDFSGVEIDTNRWTAKGRTVKVENGIAQLVVEETDNWGRLVSAYFTFDPHKPITVKSRIKIMYSQNLKDKVYFHGYFGFSPKTSLTDESEMNGKLLFGVKFENYDYESKFPDGNTDEQKAEGFFLVREGSDPNRRIDYESGKVSPRIEPVWDKWFEQKIIYEPFSGKMSYFVNGELKKDFNVGQFQTDLPENQLRLEIMPEGWWLYHSIEIDYIEITQ